MSRKLLITGLAGLTSGLMLIALSQAGGVASTFAGEPECVTWTPTRTNTPVTNTATPVPPTSTPIPPTNTPIPPTAELGQISAFGNQTPQRTCVNTNTPTRTSTPVNTNTPAPSATSVPATSTPTGGSQGGGVQPPNTGFGDTGSESSSMMLLLAGASLAILGGGTALAGIRRRG